MNKRLIALFLCLVMMLSVFLAGCAESSEEEAKNELEQAKVASNMTLTMWIVSEAPVSAEIRNDVTQAINALTKAKYKTQLEIYYLSEEEYFSKVTDAMETFQTNKQQQNAGNSGQPEAGNGESNVTAEEIVTDENGMFRDNYPVVLQDQVDIIYIGTVKDGQGNILMRGQEMYNKLRADDWLVPLDEAIKGDAKKLKEFVSPTLLSAVQEQGVTYAIPNNNVIGNYTYMCLNKELLERYSLHGYLARGAIKGFANEHVYQFIDQIGRYEPKSVLPIGATYEECLSQLAYYWNINPEDYSINSEEFSIFGTPLFDLQPSRGQNVLGTQSLFENEEFTEHYLALNKYRIEERYRFKKNEADGTYFEDRSEKVVFFDDDDDDTNNDGITTYGIRFLSSEEEGFVIENGIGTYQGTEYYLVPIKYPTATEEDIYGNMLAVARTTLDANRSMQIITYLNTNQEIRNLLQYGIEGQHYTVENTETVGEEKVKIIKRKADKNGNEYIMDIYATGNAFLAYLEADPNLDEAIWVNGKEQNRNSLVEPMLGFNLAEYAQAATQFGIPIKIEKMKQYSTTFRSGLSKDVLSQDPTLGAWLAECDNNPKKGVYVFRSREETDSKEYSEILYFYNNTGAFRFGVESLEEEKEGGGYFRVNTYTYTADENLSFADYGYTLTVVYDTCPTRYVKTTGEGDQKTEVPYKVMSRTVTGSGDSETDTREELTYTETFYSKKDKYDFDLYSTNSYELNIYGDLYLGDFYENKAIYNELKKLLTEAKENKNNKKNTGLYWVDKTSSQEKDYHTFILYRANIGVTTQVDIVPALVVDGDGNQTLTLMVNYDEYEGKVIEDPQDYKDNKPGARPGKRYTLYYVTLETEKNVNVSIAYSLSETKTLEIDVGPIFLEFASDNATVADDTFFGLVELTPIEFNPCGMLNTELIKYMAELNEVVIGLLDTCDTMEKLETMMGYLSILLNTEKELFNLFSDFPANLDETFESVAKDPNSIIYEKNFKELFYQLTHITNHGTMQDVTGELPSIASGGAVDAGEYRPIFYSPYGIYYLWMEAYQYLPANVQSTK